MNIQVSTKSFRETDANTIVVAVFKDETASEGVLQEVDKLSGGVVASILESGEIKGKAGETAFVYLTPSENLKATRLLLICVGDKDKYKANHVSVLAGTAARYLRGKNVKTFALVPRCDDDALKVAQNAAQGAIFSLFEIDKYRTSDKEERTLEGFTLIVENGDETVLKNGIERGSIIGDSMNFTRDMCNEPSNILTPTEMANRASQMAKDCGLTCEILDEAAMAELGMGSLLSVSQGSEEPAKLIVLKYEPKSSTANGELLAFVGKGVTFDTGGISIKNAEGMDAMKYDMSGGGTVIGTMRAIGLLKPSIPVLGIVGAVENMPDGKATNPGDIVTAMNGKTIEILNTDAEGRLVLADAVAYAESIGATDIIDMATLTGAVIIALGDMQTAVLGIEEDQDLISEIIASGKDVGEKFWQLPLDADYMEMVKTPIADVKNIGAGRKAGTIMGAAFIKLFVDKARWAHLDIAGTAWNDDPKPFRSKGPSGVAIRTLVNLVEKRAE
ncbi:MAG: leucyl aminopeptidase [Pyrinomonadaceae bacterium]|nr:leucyl aminopeptidase [Pyrinomonadaceae bacterium]